MKAAESPSAPPPRVAVIIVSWNACGLLQQCLPSVLATDYPNLEVLLVDNGSTDDSVAWVREHLPEVRILELPDNLGYCGGNNRGIEATDAPYYVLLNNDVEVDPGWLRPLVERLEQTPDIAAAQPKLLQFVDRSRFEYAGACGGHLDRWGYPFARGRVFFELEEDRGQYQDPTDIFWASGAAFFLRREAVEQVGLLDEAFEFHMEEIDLCWRLKSAGWRVVSEPESVAWHIGGSSLPQGSPRKTRYNFRNSLLMLYKNLPAKRWRRVFPIRAALDMVAALRFLLRGEFRNAGAVIQAYAQAHRMKDVYEQPLQGVPPSYRGSVVADYYLRGRKTFGVLPQDQFEPHYLRAERQASSE